MTKNKANLRDNMKVNIKTNNETGTMKIDDVEFNAEQVRVLSYFLEAFEQKVIDQVCDEIREMAEKNFVQDDDYLCYYLFKNTFYEIVDQVEQAKESMR